MAHTPGPWVRRIESHVGGAKDNLTELSVFQGPWNGHNTERKVAGKVVDGPATDADEADFRLIEAAPELLEALKAIMAEYPDMCADLDRCADPNTLAKINRARAAIAKAQKGA